MLSFYLLGRGDAARRWWHPATLGLALYSLVPLGGFLVAERRVGLLLLLPVV